MERPIRPDIYPNAIAEGFYVLIQFINPEVYRLYVGVLACVSLNYHGLLYSDSMG